MKTFIANETLLLIDGEINLLTQPDTNVDGLQNYTQPYLYEGKAYQLLASTKQLPNVKQLPREVFVKGVDVEELARIEAKTINYPAVATGFYSGFIYGYNANKNEFAEQEVIQICTKIIKEKMYIHEAIQSVRKLSLPQSITTNDELEIIKIEW